MGGVGLEWGHFDRRDADADTTPSFLLCEYGNSHRRKPMKQLFHMELFTGSKRFSALDIGSMRCIGGSVLWSI